MRELLPMKPCPLKTTILGFAIAATFTGCSDDDTNPVNADASVVADAAVALDAAAMKNVSIDFAAMVGAEAFACSDNGAAKSYTNLGSSNSTASFKDFRFYVSNVRLIDANSNEVAVTLDQTNFQFEDVVLLDFEDGTGGCVDLGNTPMNTSVVGQVPAGTYTGLAFDLAVPFDKNHMEAASVSTPPPLNIMGLFWNWQIGHKYGRVDLVVEGAAGWNVHLGSTGCVSDGTAEAPMVSCGKPNVAKIAISNFDPDSDTVAIDMAALLSNSDLTTNAAGPPGCQSFPADVDDCTPMYPNLGLSFDTGECVDNCVGQTMFKKMN